MSNIMACCQVLPSRQAEVIFQFHVILKSFQVFQSNVPFIWESDGRNVFISIGFTKTMIRSRISGQKLLKL